MESVRKVMVFVIVCMAMSAHLLASTPPPQENNFLKAALCTAGCGVACEDIIPCFALCFEACMHIGSQANFARHELAVCRTGCAIADCLIVDRKAQISQGLSEKEYVKSCLQNCDGTCKKKLHVANAFEISSTKD